MGHLRVNGIVAKLQHKQRIDLKSHQSSEASDMHVVS